MRYVEAPHAVPAEDLSRSLFLAGGISGASDWQVEMRALLSRLDITLINPRRASFDVSNADVAREQIEWEHKYLRGASAISFWFPPETLCPITLFELGAWAYATPRKPLFVGVDEKYARSFDVETQLRLQRPEIEVVWSLEELAAQIEAWAQSLT